MFADLIRYVWVRVSLQIQDHRAVTSIEYALIAALISVIIISAVITLGKNVGSTFNKISSEL
jgi:pilus assembly protein Flp/PilA